MTLLIKNGIVRNNIRTGTFQFQFQLRTQIHCQFLAATIKACTSLIKLVEQINTLCSKFQPGLVHEEVPPPRIFSSCSLASASRSLVTSSWWPRPSDG